MKHNEIDQAKILTQVRESGTLNPEEIGDVFIVVYNPDGSEMLSFRKSFMETRNVTVEEMISMHPGTSFESVKEVKAKSWRDRFTGKS